MSKTPTDRVVNLGLAATSGGTTWNLNTNDIRLLAYDGTGILNARRVSQKSPGQRGTTDLGYGQQARYISLTWQLVGHDLPHYYATLRGDLLAALQPREFDSIQIVFDVPGVGLRAADVNLDGDLDFLATDRKFTLQNVSALLKADDPRLYHPTQQTVSMYPLAAGTGWQIDWEIPWFISGSTVYGSTTINYASGDDLAAPEYPSMLVHGPITDPAITNTTTNERIELSGLTLATGEYVTVDLGGGPYRNAAPRIRNHLDVTVEQYLTSDNDLNTWHFAPARELLYDGTRATGSNKILLQGNSGNSNTQLQILYYNRYIGF